MSIYHCSIKIISRSTGRSAVSAAAYRAGVKLHNMRDDRDFDFTKKHGVVAREIFLPEAAPEKYKNREHLWNTIEAIEKRNDAQLAREFEVALPVELSRDQQKAAVKVYCQFLTGQGMICDAALHDKGDGNPHAHIMATMRSLLPTGEFAPKARKVYHLDEDGNKVIKKRDKTGRIQYDCHTEKYNDWDNKENVEIWRSKWAEVCNQYLLPEQKVDHRSYKRQGIEQTPTIHEGYAARAIESKGMTAQRCQINRDICAGNDLVGRIKTENEQLEKEISSLQHAPEADKYADAIRLEKELKIARQEVRDADRQLESTARLRHSIMGEGSTYQLALTNIDIIMEYGDMAALAATKRFGAKKYRKLHELELSKYQQAEKWMQENGFSISDAAEIQKKLEINRKKYLDVSDRCAAEEKKLEILQTNFDRINAEFNQELDRIGLDYYTYFEEDDLESFLKSRNSPQNRSQGGFEEKGQDYSHSSLKTPQNRSQGEIESVNQSHYGTIDLSGESKPGRLIDLSGKNFAERMAAAKKEADERNLSRTAPKKDRGGWER